MNELNTFEAILKELLESVEKNPEMSIESLLILKAKELGLSEDAISGILETNSLVDIIDDKVIALIDMREKGETRSSFISKSLETITLNLNNSTIEELDSHIESFTDILIENNKEE